MPIMLPPASPPGLLKFYWVDKNGVAHNLSYNDSPRLFVPQGSAGLGSNISELHEDKFPFSSGTLLRHIAVPARKVELPIYIFEDNIGDLLDVTDALFDWFDTGDESQHTPGYLKVTRPDGTSRKLLCYYESGLQGDMKEGSPQWTRYVVSLHAPDPYPTEESDTIVTKNYTQATSGFTIINQGKLPAYPRWKLYGPFNNVTITNLTNGKVLSSEVGITTGNYMIIDTRPSIVRPGFSVYDHLGNNIQTTITPTSSFWPLLSGSNHIIFNYTSGTSGATSVELTYLARYRSLLR